MRRAAKRDQNETVIKQQLMDLGFAVAEISSPAIPDLLCWHSTYGLFLIEVKARKGKLTKAQVDFHAAFGDCPQIIIGREIDQILKDMGVSS